MSLLIKALDKAQDAKVKQAQAEAVKQEQAKKVQAKRPKASKAELTIAEVGSELSLSPPEASLLEDVGYELDFIPSSLLESAVVKVKEAQPQKEVFIKPIDKPAEKVELVQAIAYTNTPVKTTQRVPLPLDPRAKEPTPMQAANVFTAKRIEATHQNTKLAVIAGAGLIAMLAMGVYYYQFVDSTPDVPMPPIRPPQIAVAPPTSEPVASEPMPPEADMPDAPEVEAAAKPDTTQAFEPRETDRLAQKQKNMQQQIADETIANVENSLDANEVVASPSKRSAKSNAVKMDKAIASDSASIQVSQSKPQDAVNPLVMRAYEAYNAGNDSEAQKLYKQALQRDSSNVDAMLGLGAIATRQGRAADANDWYRKVLGIEPRNSTAQSGILDSQQQADPQADESRIKSMLAKSPIDANLHAALGNLYAEQNQWAAAQQAYFDAYRLNESADNAFNLGVSLDQMGKPKLALPYYQQALQMAQQSGGSGIDKAALEARIASIQ